MGHKMRNYDTPDPARVVSNITRVLASGDMTLLEKGAYNFLITHCGFIAHYDHGGFIATYREDMVSFAHLFLWQMGEGWDSLLENPNSYLYDVSYKGKPLADIIRELIPVFRAYQPIIEAAQQDRAHRLAEAHLHALAEDLGYDLVKKRKEAA
ncbi:MAG: hypothetical protein Q8R28_11390 [Dehalococcoidia bacterium]|nr:hypothetical protein [Dehalococcoidia bacterium]